MSAPQQQRVGEFISCTIRCLNGDWLLLLTVDGWREPTGRMRHRTAVVDNQLYLWGGTQQGMPEVHDSAEKRQFFSSVEVFDVNTGCWEQRTTSGTPPLGVTGYSCVAVRNDLHYFGGWCGHGDCFYDSGHKDCYYNSVHALSTSTLQWRMLAPQQQRRGTNEGEILQLWNGALHWWRGGPLVCGGRDGSCCPIITTSWRKVSIIVFLCVYPWTTHFLSVHKWVILIVVNFWWKL